MKLKAASESNKSVFVFTNIEDEKKDEVHEARV